MFTKILIANRGEIACRIIRTAHRLGIQCVAVYSDIDKDALHVSLADEAWHIGSAPVSDSYLCIDRIIDAALKSGAQAIHPGYGLLSENAVFAEACEKAGICFIGPPVKAIRAMGSKSVAKRMMQEAGISVIPGYDGEEIAQAAAEIGYPILLKPAAGGGGKGIHIVSAAGELPELLARARREAQASFGDQQIILEKYIEQPRHIEIQIFADKFGNVVHLFERDCSIQRRHQKIVEEAPAMHLSSELRLQLGSVAVAAAKRVGYVGAGTVEFLVDAQENFYFMEMNTRLQVEHPVTEQITGKDFVEWQLRIAAGEKLPCTQQALEFHGHAIEVRICAEDPSNDFLPSIGPLVHLHFPEEHLPYVRIETGVQQGDSISPYYDSMIAKLIVWDLDRSMAIARLKTALSECQIVGIESNLDFLTQLISLPEFKEGGLYTNFVERTKFAHASSQATPTIVALTVLYLLLLQTKKIHQIAEQNQERNSPWFVADNWQMNLMATQTIRFYERDQEKTVSVIKQTDHYQLNFDNQSISIQGQLLPDLITLQAILDDRELHATVVPFENQLYVFAEGQRHCFRLHTPDTAIEDIGLLGGKFCAPMPGTVVALLTEKDVLVAAGQGLIVIEAMKMEHTLYAPTVGYVKDFYFKVGDLVDEGIQLLEFEPKYEELS
jgi:3-methylcrotonyl-CoA carboxylase alpha subunit